MFSIFVSVNDVRKACLAATAGTAKEQAIKRAFHAPAFFLEYNRLRFHTGVDRETWQTELLLAVPSALQLVQDFEHKLNISLKPVRAVVTKAGSKKYESVQAVSIPTVEMYNAIIKSFAKLAKQSKSQALYADSRRALLSATEHANSQGRGSAAVMFLSLDFEWWERADDTILEVGWSLWDTVSQRHRTRHWVIKENLNKCNGRYISDNRSAFLFGSSDRGSLDKAMDALQDEVDKRGVSEGLNKQQKDTLHCSDVQLVLVGHNLSADVDKAELHEIEWPEGMVKFDTQQLYMAWQLKQLDAAAGGKALEAVVTSQNGKPKSAVATVAAVSVHDFDHPSDEDDDWVHGTADEDEQPAAAETAANGKRVSSPAVCVTQPAGKKKGKPQVQNPPRVRPWPAGPPAADPNRPAAALAEEQEQGTPNAGTVPKVDHQASLGTLCGVLGIKTSKLHNAGNDARFTMEAFLTLAGHEVCSDPVQAHLDFSRNDPRYQQQLEESIAAAAALGFGTPSEPISSTAALRPGSQTGSVGWGRAGHNSRPGSNSNSENGSYTEHDVQRSASGKAVGHLAVPPGFAAGASAPPGFTTRGSNSATSPPPGFAGAAPASLGDGDVPPGFQQAHKIRPTPAAAPAAKAWGSGGSSGAAVAVNAGSWAQRAGGGRDAPARAAGAAGTPAAAGMTSTKPSSQFAWKVDPLAYNPSSSSNATTASGWGAPQRKQAAGFGSACNSSTGTGNASAGYEPNPDGW